METIMSIKSSHLKNAKNLYYDLSIIHSHLDDPNGENKVALKAGNIFDHFFGGEIASLKQLGHDTQEEKENIQNQKLEKEKQIQDTPEYLPTPQQIKVPWNFWNRSEIYSLLVMSLIFIGVGVSSVASNLRSTGEAIFIESPWLLWIMSSIPLGAAIILKSFARHMRPTIKHRYTLLLYVTCIVLCLIWIFLFSKFFNGLTQSVIDVIDAIVYANLPNTTEYSSKNLFLFIQLSAECTGAAALWLTASKIYEMHHQQRTQRNPFYKQLKEDLSKIEQEVQAINNKLTKYVNELISLQEARKVYINNYLNDYKTKQWMRDQKKPGIRIIDVNPLKTKFLKGE